jgi:hypothetical protein
MRHCEPFAFCHSDPVSSTGEESHYFAQDKLREAISRDCHACVPKRTSVCRHVASLLAMTTFQGRSL